MTHKNFAKVKEQVLIQYDAAYGDEEDEDPMTVDPNNFDVDPVPFYESLAEIFDVDFDEAKDNFGGFGGTLAETIEFIAQKWDGKTINLADEDDDDEGFDDDDLDEDLDDDIDDSDEGEPNPDE